MARYFWGGTLASFFRSSTAVEDGDLTAGRSDSTFCPNGAIAIAGINDFIDTEPFVDASAVTTLYWRWDVYPQQSGAGATNGAVMASFFDSVGTEVARFVCVDGVNRVLQFKYWNGSSFASYGPTYTIPNNELMTFMAKIVAGASGSFNLWLGDAIIIFDPGTGMNAAFDNIAKVRIYGWTSGTTYYSQLMGGDYDLRNDKYIALLATGEGTYTDGTGTYTAINEQVLDDSTAIVLPAHGNKHTFVHTAITVPEGYAIAAKTVNARGRVSGGTITDGEILIKSGTTLLASTGRGYNAGYEPRGFYSNNDPNTVLPWTQSGFNAAEFGAEAP